MVESRGRGGSGGLVRPGADAEVIDPGLAVIVAIVPAKQEHLAPAEGGHGVGVSSRRPGGGPLRCAPG